MDLNSYYGNDDFLNDSTIDGHSHIAPDFLALTSQQLVNSVCNDSEPSSFEEASLNPAWKSAMPQEYEALHTLGLFLVMVKKPNRTVIGTKLI
ncbi:hypothetical protein H5410_004356 [Solanum commersonii]|uniref:Uncharacterized protein n=1 Tax=Solanum commersonii TaxID=4109 RepID=A0A9J6B880_SOLCO|nr:hypothetical protein H5410_004356 [Solanum commersonii]